jgi:hypothetical protein
MSTALLNRNRNENGAKPHPSQTWKRQTVQQFFGAFNWDDHSLTVQELKLTATQQQGSDRPLSLTLKVQDFFAAVNWDGSAIAALPILERSAIDDPAADSFTLDSFSDLF